MAIDIGDRRTGLATGDDITNIVQPLSVIDQPNREHLLRDLVAQIAAHDPDVIIIGLPFNMDGTEGPRAKMTRAFGEQLGKLIERPVEYHDERLTSFAAEEHLKQSGRTHRQKKQVRDALAAVEIMRDYLRHRAETDEPSPEISDG